MSGKHGSEGALAAVTRPELPDGVCRFVRGIPVGIRHRVAELRGFCGARRSPDRPGQPGLEHQVPQLLQAYDRLLVTQRHRERPARPEGIPRLPITSGAAAVCAVRVSAHWLSGRAHAGSLDRATSWRRDSAGSGRPCSARTAATGRPDADPGSRSRREVSTVLPGGEVLVRSSRPREAIGRSHRRPADVAPLRRSSLEGGYSLPGTWSLTSS
jgi:hypothetical protein